MKDFIRGASLLSVFLIPFSLCCAQNLETDFQNKHREYQLGENSSFDGAASISTSCEGTGRLAFAGPSNDGLQAKGFQGTDDVLHFEAGGHVLGFRKGEMFIASADHALKIGFIGARLVSPANEEKSMDAGDRRQGAPPLGRVLYDNLWDGVTLVYERHESGVVKSTYLIRPAGADAVSPVGRIRLRYDLPVAVDEGGGLVFSFENGHMRESRPLAWQVVNGEHVPVEVSFRPLGKREIGFRVESYDPKFPLVIDPVLSWHTYMGSADEDFAHDIAVDGSGNVYVAGWSEATWGTPIDPHAGGRDAFVAKLSPSGERLWHTFMGSSGWDEANGVAVDGSGNIYVAGTSDTSWGAPVHFHAGGRDAFAAKFDGNGVRQWHTFMGHFNDDDGVAIAVDASGHVYVGGGGGWYWDTLPVYPPLGGNDGWVAKLNAYGGRQWYTLVGSADLDFLHNIAVDENSNVYAMGKCHAGWGNPINPYAGGADVFVWKLNSSGKRVWHTYMGSGADDFGTGITVDGDGNVYVSGYCPEAWGEPINPFAGAAIVEDNEGFAAKLNSNGTREWHTFLGSEGSGGGDVVVDRNGGIYVGGLKLGPEGRVRWNVWIEAGVGVATAIDTSGNLYFGGGSAGQFGTPVDPFTGFMGVWDAYAAKVVGTADNNYTVAAIAHTPGVGTSLWRSKLGVLNRSGERADVTLSYVRGGPTMTTTERIAHGVLRTWDDAAVSLFGISGNSSGSVFIDSTQPLVVSSRTYDEGVEGTFGSFLPGVTAGEDLGYGEIGVLSQLCGNNDFRTNVGLVSLVSAMCQVEVQVHAADGTEMGSPETVNLQAHGFKQVNDVFRSTGSGSLNNAYVTVEVTTPDCRVWGYGAVIDGVAAHPGTDDATTIPLAIVSH